MELRTLPAAILEGDSPIQGKTSKTVAPADILTAISRDPEPEPLS